jgi:hypothetical protein
VLPSDAGEGPSDAPVPAAAGEDAMLAAVPTAEGAQEVVAEPAVEGPTAAAGEDAVSVDEVLRSRLIHVGDG